MYVEKVKSYTPTNISNPELHSPDIKKASLKELLEFQEQLLSVIEYKTSGAISEDGATIDLSKI